MNDFDFDFNFSFEENVHSVSIEEKKVQERAIKRRMKNEEIHLKSAKALNDLCGIPERNEQWRIVTEKAFNAYAFIRLLLETREIEELHIAIYRINRPTVDSLIELIESGRIKKATFIISSFFNQTKKPEEWAKQLAFFCSQNENTRFAFLHNHAKIVCAKCGEDYFVFEGSGNMSDNARIEQYTFENNEKVYNFHCDWMDRLVSDYENDTKV